MSVLLYGKDSGLCEFSCKEHHSYCHSAGQVGAGKAACMMSVPVCATVTEAARSAGVGC